MVKRWSKDPVMFLLALFVLVVKKVSFRSYTKQKSGKALHYILGVCFCKVLSRVLFQLTGQFAWVAALLAGKRFLTTVWKHVILKAIRATERIVTLLTCKRLFSNVCELVINEMFNSSARMVTQFTPEGLLFWMDQHVSLEATSCCGWTITLCAAEKFFSWMPFEATSRRVGVVALCAVGEVFFWLS